MEKFLDKMDKKNFPGRWVVFPLDLREIGQDDPKTSQNETFLNLEDKIQFIEDSLGSFQASTPED